MLTSYMVQIGVLNIFNQTTNCLGVEFIYLEQLIPKTPRFDLEATYNAKINPHRVALNVKCFRNFFRHTRYLRVRFEYYEDLE